MLANAGPMSRASMFWLISSFMCGMFPYIEQRLANRHDCCPTAGPFLIKSLSRLALVTCRAHVAMTGFCRGPSLLVPFCGDFITCQEIQVRMQICPVLYYTALSQSSCNVLFP